MAVPTMTSNSPVAGSIAWTAFAIQYKGVAYSVPAGSTSQRWVWWRFNGGAPLLEGGADIPSDITDDDFILFGNKNGIAARIQASSLIDGELIVDGSIFAPAISAHQIESTHISAVGLDAGLVKFGEMDGTLIKSKSIDADQLVADIILSKERIVAGDETTGQSVELSPTGFYVYGAMASDGSRPVYVSFPTSGGSAGKPNIISGTLQATTLSVAGDSATGQAATFRQNTVFEQGATVTLNNAIVAPVARPSVQSITHTTMLNFATVVGDLGGMAYHAAQNAVYFVTAAIENNVGVNRIYKLDLTTYLATLVTTVTLTGQSNVVATGLTYVGGTFYVSYMDYLNTNMFVAKYSAAWAQTASISLGTLTKGQWFTIGNDGTDIWVADLASTTNWAPRFRRYTAALSTNVAAETVNSSYAYDTAGWSNLISLNVGSFDMGARKFVVSFMNTQSATPQPYFVTYDTVGAHDTNNDFLPMSTSYEHYLVWKGASNNASAGTFLGLGLRSHIAKLYAYTALKLSGANPLWYAAYSFYRTSDGAETTVSPVQSWAMNSRWGWMLTVVTPPSGLSARVYIGTTSGGDPTTLHLQYSGLTSPSLLLDTYTAAGAAPKTVGTFGSSNPAILQTQQTITKSITIATTSGSTSITSPGLKTYMIGRSITGGSIPAGTTIVSVVDGVSAVLSAAPTASATGVTATVTVPQMEIRGDGYARITTLESVILSSETDANTNSGNKPPLRVGNVAGVHLRIDGDEIISMTSDNSRTGALLTLTADDVAFNLVSGGAKITGGANYFAKFRSTADPGSAITLQNGQVVASTPAWVGGTPSASNTVRFDALDIHSWSGGIFLEDLAAASGTTATINLNGRIVRTSSSKRFKEQIEPLSLEYARRALDLEPVSFVWKPEMDMGDRRVVGVIAEQAKEAGLDHLIHYDQDEEVSGFDYNALAPLLLVMLKDALYRLSTLERN